MRPASFSIPNVLPLESTPKRSDTAPTPDLPALIRAIHRGDEGAFDRFYETYCDRLYCLLVGLTRGDEATARDVLQTLMLKVVHKLPVVKTEGELWSWLARVARNATIDQYRSRSRSPLDFVPEIGIELQLPEGAGSDDFLFTWLEEAIERLDEESQKLLRAFYFECQSYESLARELGKTPKAIESKLARIRLRLRSSYEEKGPDEQT